MRAPLRPAIMIISFAALLGGLIFLALSADRFVEGAAALAHHFGISPLLIGMLIVGFGTSAPEIVVSVFAALQGNPGLALGNAYGSNISNIALILGLTAFFYPLAVNARTLRRELPVLCAVSVLALWQLLDGMVSRFDALVLYLVFFCLVALSVWHALRNRNTPETETEESGQDHPIPLAKAWLLLLGGMVVLTISSRVLVWGAVDIAQSLGISDLIIGLTIVAIGTSLPELASTISAARQGRDDIALGNIIGSNIFNTLTVVGTAGILQPFAVEAVVIQRDMVIMLALTAALLIMGIGWRKRPGRINRFKGAALVTSYVLYLLWIINTTAFSSHS